MNLEEFQNLDGNEFKLTFNTTSSSTCIPSNESWLCVICLQNCTKLTAEETNVAPVKDFRTMFETFSKYLHMRDDLKSLESFTDSHLFTKLFHCCDPCEIALTKLHELSEQLKLLVKETALISATLTAKIIESSQNISRTVTDSTSCKSIDAKNENDEKPIDDESSQSQLPPSQSTLQSDQLKLETLPSLTEISFDEQKLLTPNLRDDRNLYCQSVPEEARWFRRQVLSNFDVKVSLTGVENRSPTDTEPDLADADVTKSTNTVRRAKRKRKAAKTLSLKALCKTEADPVEEIYLSDDYANSNNDADTPFTPNLSEVDDEDVDFMLSVMLPTLSTTPSAPKKRTVKRLKKAKAAKIKVECDIPESNAIGNPKTKKPKFAGSVKPRKLRSKMYRETSPNKYLYAEKFPFEKTEDGFKCGSCDFTYDSSNKISPMVSHVREKHFMKKTNRPYYKSCKLVTIGPNKFLYRGKCIIDKIDDIYKCGACDYSSEIRRLTCRHVRLQHFMTEKTKACKHCGKLFLTTDKLKLHESRHTEERPYICEICGKSFKIAQSLGLHKKTHTGEADKNKVCEICGKKFAFSQVLKKHLVTHSGEKNYECDICHTKFGDAGTLRNHRRTHDGLKLYSCDLCGMRFSQSGSVHRHVRSVHKKIPRSDSKKNDKLYPGGNEMVVSDELIQPDGFGPPSFHPYPVGAQFPFK